MLSNTIQRNLDLELQLHSHKKSMDVLTYIASVELSVVFKLWLHNTKYINRIKFDGMLDRLSAGLHIFYRLLSKTIHMYTLIYICF